MAKKVKTTSNGTVTPMRSPPLLPSSSAAGPQEKRAATKTTRHPAAATRNTPTRPRAGPRLAATSSRATAAKVVETADRPAAPWPPCSGTAMFWGSTSGSSNDNSMGSVKAHHVHQITRHAATTPRPLLGGFRCCWNIGQPLQPLADKPQCQHERSQQKPLVHVDPQHERRWQPPDRTDTKQPATSTPTKSRPETRVTQRPAATIIMDFITTTASTANTTGNNQLWPRRRIRHNTMARATTKSTLAITATRPPISALSE